MCGITSGRTEPCADSIGGLKNVYLFTWVEYQKYLIEVDGNELISYPTTTIYKYEVRADGNNVNETLEQNEDGISYTQSLSVVLKKIQDNYYNDTQLINKRVGCIVETRKNEFHIIGLFNGCRVSNINVTSGGGRSDFNGINLTLNAREKKQMFFIDNLASAGFIVDGGTTDLLSSSDLISSTSVLSSATFY